MLNALMLPDLVSIPKVKVVSVVDCRLGDVPNLFVEKLELNSMFVVTTFHHLVWILGWFHTCLFGVFFETY